MASWLLALTLIPQLVSYPLPLTPLVNYLRRKFFHQNVAEPAAEAEPDGPGLDEPAAVVAVEEGGTDDGVLSEEDEAQNAGTTNDSTSVVLPDFSGMSMGEAIRAARKAGVDMVPSGSGLAANQTPKPGTVPAGTVCRVSFQRVGG